MSNKNTDTLDLSTDSTDIRADIADNSPRIETLREAIAPTAMKRGAIDYIIVGNHYARTFYIEGLPNYVTISYLTDLYDRDYDVDVSMNITPRASSEARQDLQNKLTIAKAKWQAQVEHNDYRKRDVYEMQIHNLEKQLSELATNEEQAFEVQLFFTLYASSKAELERNSSSLLADLKSSDITAYSFDLRQDDAWKSVLPYCLDYVNDKKRNFNTGALICSVPFYLPEISDENGVYLGENAFPPHTPALIDVFKPGIPNSNLNIFGASGSGKTTTVKVLTMRSALHGIRTVIIDPEGEYKDLTTRMHGAYMKLSSNPKTSQMMNIFDVEETETTDPNTGEMVKDLELRNKYEDVLGFIQVVDPEVTQGQAASILKVVEELYKRAGFVDGDPKSLYYGDDLILSKDGHTLINNPYKKRMPQLSDFLDLMSVLIKEGTYPELDPVYKALLPYRSEQSRGLFDTQTPKALQNLNDASIITFDVSDLESNGTRATAMYVLLSWTWEKFGKKNPEIKKRILVDEAWMMMDPSMAGSEYTSSFLETMSRRIRKRNGSLTVATQRISDFNSTQAGKSIITNAYTTFLLSHSVAEKEDVERAFELDSGVVDNIIDSPRGNVLIKQGSQLYLVNVALFDNDILSATGHAATDNQLASNYN